MPARTPAGPTPELIEKLKGDMVANGLPPKIYKLEFEGETFIWRPLFKADWEEIQAFIEANKATFRPDMLDEKICQRAIMYPQAVHEPGFWDLQRAGIMSQLAKHISARSGFFDADLDQSSYMRMEPLNTLERGPRPDEKVVQELKAKYPRWRLYQVLIDTEYYVVRPLTRKEWRDVQTEGATDMDHAAVDKGVLWSESYPNSPDFNQKAAGSIRSLSEVIMSISGFGMGATVEEL